jgi:hypothetical protein
MPRRARLLHVVVQPHIVIDDGESLEPRIGDAITVPATDWPTFATEQWPALLASLQEQLDAEDAPPAQASA